MVQNSVAERGVDDITLGATLQQLATMHRAIGDDESAAATTNRIVDIFRDRVPPPQVLAFLQAQEARMPDEARADTTTQERSRRRQATRH